MQLRGSEARSRRLDAEVGGWSLSMLQTVCWSLCTLVILLAGNEGVGCLGVPGMVLGLSRFDMDFVRCTILNA